MAKKPKYDQWVIDFIVKKCRYTTENAVAYMLGIEEDYVVDISDENECRQKVMVPKPLYVLPESDQIIMADLISGNGRIKMDNLGCSFRSDTTPNRVDLLEWKYFRMGNLIKGKRIYIMNLDNKFDNKIGYQTNRTEALNFYYNANIEGLINSIGYYGLLVLLCSDATYESRRSKLGNIAFSSVVLNSIDENYRMYLYELLLTKYRSIGLNGEVKKYGNKISIIFDKDYNLTIINLITSFMPEVNSNIRKFQYILSNICEQKQSVHVLQRI